jgi:polyhydroxyalkanoate synthase subunit PhaC
MPAKAEDWQENSSKHTDSWWLHWQAWQAQRSGDLKPSPTSLGNKKHAAAEAAPGTYVHER